MRVAVLWFNLWRSRYIKRSLKMELYESDTEGDEQETPLLPGGREVTFQKPHKGIFVLFHVANFLKIRLS